MTIQPKTCEQCGQAFLPKYGVTLVYWARRRFCSGLCRIKGMRGEGRSTRGQPRSPITDRFWAKVAKGDGCWEWSGARQPSGYGFLHSGRSGKRFELAHRVSWEIHNGPIPDGLVVCHHCDNPPCVNPAHLFLGTRGDNNRDRSNKGRNGHQPWGERSSVVKISHEDVLAIRAAVASGETQQVVADRFHIRQGSVSRIVLGQSRRYD